MTATAAGLPPDRRDRGPGLYIYTAIEIAVGSLVLAWAVLAAPLEPAISLTGDTRPGALLAGLAFWSAFGLLGGTRVGSIHGFGFLTFHLPFIVAAAALGGPAAGGVVAFVATTELRELREQPWYGLLANHAALALAGVAAGAVMSLATQTLGPLGLGPEPTTLLAFGLGAVAFVVLSVSLATGTSILRDGLTSREVIAAYAGSFRATMVTEVVVGWLLALAYRLVGPWASVVSVVVVLQLIGLIGEQAFRGRDQAVPRLLTYDALQRKTRSIARLTPIGYLIIRIEGWKTYVDACGRTAADELAGRISNALGAAIFGRDEAARSADGEWQVLLVRVPLEGALVAALKLWRKVRAVVDEGPGGGGAGGPGLEVRIGGGVPEMPDHGGAKAIALAEQALFHAQRERIPIVIRTERTVVTADPCGTEQSAE